MSNIHIIAVPKEEKDQEIGKLSEKLVKENFPNLVEGTRRASPGNTESQTR